MADKNTISTRISLEGAEDIIKAFRAMGGEGEEVARKLEKAFAAIGIGNKVVSNIDKVKRAFRSLGTAAQTVGRSFKGIGDNVGKLGNAVGNTRNRVLLFTAALTGIAYGFKSIVSGSLDAIGSLSDLSESLNISAEDLQAFNFAAAQIGVDSGDFTKGIVSINDALKELREASKKALSSGIKPAIEDVVTAGGKVIRVYRGIQSGSKDTAKATDGLSDRARALATVFNKMGVSVNKDLTEFETLKVIANYFKDVAKEGDKLGLAVDLFGPKLGPKLVRYLNLGADGIEGFKTELKDLGILLSSDEVALGDKAGDQLAKLAEVFNGFRAKLAVALSPGIIAAADAVTNVIKANAATINAFLAEAGKSFSLFVKDIVSLASGNDQALAFPWLIDLRDGLISAYTNAKSLIFDVLIPGFQALAGYLEPVAQGINAIFGTELIRGLWNSVVSFISSSLDSIVSKVRSVIDYITSAISKVRQLISSSKASTTSQGGGSGYASGGPVWGSGTSTSDSIPAWLSNGEFVIRAAAVKRYGADLFAALNGMRLAPNLLNRFANGGLVGLPSMAMAALPALAGGPSSSLTLVLDNQAFGGLTGPADTIQRLERAIKSRRIRSTGRTSPYER